MASSAPSECAAARACARPRSLSGGSACPCHRPSAFHSDWPCRTSRTRLATRPDATVLPMLPIDKLGTRCEPATTVIDADRAKAYAAATNDDNPAYEAGKYAPPVFGVVPTWSQMLVASADVIPPEALMFIVHGEQDMHFHQPLVPGATLTTASEIYAIRVGGSGTRLVVKVDSTDEQGQPVLTQYVTIFIRGMSDGESGGPDKPAHDFPDDARGRPVSTFTIHVDD